MSQCMRSVSSRLMTCVNSRKRLMQVDRRLPKHTKRCALLQKYDTLSVSQPKVDEVTVPYLTNRFIVGIHGNHLRPYSTTSSSPKESVVVQNYDQSPDDATGDEGARGHSPNQLEVVYNTLQKDLPKIFVSSIDYRIYHKDMEFINNLKGTTSKGLSSYIKQILYLRTSAHMMYAYVKFDILKITMHPEDNTVKVRWRIRGLSSLKVFTMFWKLRILKTAESMQGLESWHDGFSTFHVGSDGLVHKHVADKIMPDDEAVPAKAKPDIAAKLAA
ncbi:uncharacterized protein C6orf136 homolog [Diachasma alloeum]|uniref:uncharacterized protein C6orf136 homolog n=1 Tax=Diachasma alloeum TaxID=454923 RepID=UPI0007383018|nr:uncharacterized protein C6orf136 homolog [Diachasma alloeum]